MEPLRADNDFGRGFDSRRLHHNLAAVYSQVSESNYERAKEPLKTNCRVPQNTREVNEMLC